MDLISVIVPVYKVEKFLDRCVNSIVAQSYDNLEIILVDDGSPDGCPQICDIWAKKDDRIKVIHKNNGGLSDARNAGIQIMKGEYVTFVDSDDWIHKDMIMSLYTHIKSEESQVSICSYERKNMDFERNPLSGNCVSFSGTESVKKLYTPNFGISFTTAWGKLYKSNLWENIRFPFGKYHEDEFTTYKILYSARKVTYTEDKLYFYFINNESIIQSSFSEKGLDSLDAFKERINFFELRNENELALLAKKILMKRIIYCHQKICGESSIKNKKELIKKCLSYMDSSLKKIYLNETSGKEKFWTRVFFISPSFCSFIRNKFKIGL